MGSVGFEQERLASNLKKTLEMTELSVNLKRAMVMKEDPSLSEQEAGRAAWRHIRAIKERMTRAESGQGFPEESGHEPGKHFHP